MYRLGFVPCPSKCGHHFQQTEHQPGIVANPACGQLNRETEFSLSLSRLRVWSRELDSAVPSRVSPLILHTQAKSGAYLPDSTSPSRFPLRFPLEPSCAIGLVPRLPGHAFALPMAFTTENRHRTNSSQGSSINGNFLFR